MDRLGDHLFEVEPFQIRLKVGGPEIWSRQAPELRVQRIDYQLLVDCFSKTPQKLLDFLGKLNY